MSTILQVGNSEGMRRCDATCHNSTHAKCCCCCGGTFHGKKDLIAAGLHEAVMKEYVKRVFGVDVPDNVSPVKVGDGVLF